MSRPALLVDGAHGPFRQLIHDWLAFSVRAEEVRSGFGRIIGLSGTAYTILISIAHLGETEDDIGISRISEHLHLSGAFVTIEVGKLVAARLVEKRPHDQDRRRVTLAVTDHGRAELARLRPVQARVNDALFETLDAAEFALLRDLLRRLVPCGDRAVALLGYLEKAPGPDTATNGPP